MEVSSHIEKPPFMKGFWTEIDSAHFEISIHDRVAQTFAFQRITVNEQSTHLTPQFMRYAWPSELDLKAKLAGLQLVQTWAWWDRSPFTSTCKSHVSVYGRAEGEAD